MVLKRDGSEPGCGVLVGGVEVGGVDVGTSVVIGDSAGSVLFAWVGAGV